MTRPPQNARYWLAMLWLGLLLAGCLSQMNLLQGPKPGSGAFAPEAVSLVKPNPQGTGDWVSTPDGRTQLTVRIGMTQPPVGSFATKKLDLTAIAKVTATIALATGGTTVAPTNADAAGFVAAPSGSFALTFPPVDKGTKRTLTITGFTAAGIPVGSAVIKSLFDNTADTGSFEISYRTTPTAAVFQGLGATAAATVTTSGLQAAVDAITGYAGTSGVYPQCPPALVDTALMITNLNASGGDTAPIIAGPVTYRQAGTELSHSFFLPPTPVAADMPQLFCSDPSTEVFDLAPLAGSTGTFNSTNNTVTATIAANGQVQVTFHKVPPGTWKIGAKLPGDGTTPNPKYYQVAANVCGSVATLTIGGASQTAFTSEAFRAAEPTYVTGQIRWLKSTATGFQVQDLTSTMPAVLNGAAPTDSTDFNVYVGPTAAGYTFATNLIPPGAITNMQILGPANVAEANRPKLIFGVNNSFQLSSSSTIVRDVDISGAMVNLGNGGTLQRVSVEGQRIAAGTGAAISVVGSSAFLLDTVHVYDVRHMAASPTQGTDALVGIMVNTTGSGQILNSLVDDKASNSGNFSIRYTANASTASLAGIAVQAAAGITIANTNVIAIGRVTGTGVTPTQTVAGIVTSGTAPVRITGCSVSNVEALRDETGINLATGTVASCTVENLSTPAGAQPQVAGIRVGTPGGGSGAAEVLQNTIRNLGETATPSIAGSRVVGIDVNAPGTGQFFKIDGNAISGSGAQIVNGIVLGQNNASPSGFTVSNNAITTCSTIPGNSLSNFTGIDTKGTASNLNNLMVQHNDISNNTMHATGFGIRTDASTGTYMISNNRIANNSFSSTGNTFTGTQVYRMIWANASGGTVNQTIRDNLITGNTVNENTGVAEIMAFYGIVGTGGGGNSTSVQNNVLSGNVCNGSASDNGQIRYVDTAGTAKIYSNRIFDNTVSGSYPSTAAITDVVANVTLPGQSLMVDRNVLFDAGIGTQSIRPGLSVAVVSPATATFRHNSLSFMDSKAPAINITGNGDVELINNAMTTASNTGIAAAITRAASALGGPIIDGNWIFGWPSGFVLLSGANTVTSGPVFGTSSASVNVGAHLMGTNGTTGYTGGVIGAEGTSAGVFALQAAPVF